MPPRERHEDVEEDEGGFRVYICGQIGPRGDGYIPGEERMSVDEAAAYHSTQIRVWIDFRLLVSVFRVCNLFWDLGWVDFDFGSSTVCPNELRADGNLVKLAGQLGNIYGRTFL